MPDDEPALTPDAPAVHGPWSALLACALGGPIAAGVLLARNERAFGRPERFRPWLIAGALATLGLFALGAALPDSFPHAPLPAVSSLAAYLAADKLQGAPLRRHLERGGRRAGLLWALGTGLLFLALWLAVLLAAFFVLGAVKSSPAA